MPANLKSLMIGSAIAFAMGGVQFATAQDSDGDPVEEEADEEPVTTGSYVSEGAQGLGELDKDEVEGPGVSSAARDLRMSSQANLPETAMGNRPERPETAERPETPERPERPEMPERPERAERPDRPERPERPGRS